MGVGWTKCGKTDKCMGVSQILDGAPVLHHKVYACVVLYGFERETVTVCVDNLI